MHQKGLNYNLTRLLLNLISQNAAASGDEVPQTPYDYYVLYFSKLNNFQTSNI